MDSKLNGVKTQKEELLYRQMLDIGDMSPQIKVSFSDTHLHLIHVLSL